MEKLLKGLLFISPGGDWVGGEGQELLFPFAGVLKAIPELQIWGRVFLQEGWQFAWAGVVCLLQIALPQSSEDAVWKSAAIAVPWSDRFTLGIAAPGVCNVCQLKFFCNFLDRSSEWCTFPWEIFPWVYSSSGSCDIPRSSCWSLRFNHLHCPGPRASGVNVTLQQQINWLRQLMVCAVWGWVSLVKP